MEILQPATMRAWFWTWCLKYRKARDQSQEAGDALANKFRDTSQGLAAYAGEVLPGTLAGASAVTGDELLLTAVFAVNDLAKSMLGFAGRVHSVESDRTELKEWERRYLAAAQDIMGRMFRSMHEREPGLIILNPKVEDLHVGVLPDKDPLEGPVKTVKVTHRGLVQAEREIVGTRWARYLTEAGVYHDQIVGAD